jgi:hypothetical protein
MTRPLWQQLDHAASNLDTLPQPDLEALLKRASARIRHASELALDPEMDLLVDTVAADLRMTRTHVLRTIISDWMIKAGRLPPMDGEGPGSAM